MDVARQHNVPQPRTRDEFVRTDTVHIGWMHARQAWTITAALSAVRAAAMNYLSSVIIELAT